MAEQGPVHLTCSLKLADAVRVGYATILEPQDLPDRYGRVVQALDRVLAATKGEAVVGGGWAVWRHGYVGRVTQDIDIVLAADTIDEFLRVASVSGLEPLPIAPGRWPKLLHKATDIQVDILPEGGRPGTASKPAPTTIPHPSALGAAGSQLRYIELPGLVELKIAAGRAQDEADVVKLIGANPEQVAAIRGHLSKVHPDYVIAFDQLAARAAEERTP